GSVGQRILFHNMGSGSGLTAALYDPEGNQAGFSYGFTSYGTYILPAPGPYKLVVSGSQYAATGAYAFQVLDLTATPKLQVKTTEADLTVSLSAPSTQQVLVPYSTAD